MFVSSNIISLFLIWLNVKRYFSLYLLLVVSSAYILIASNIKRKYVRCLSVFLLPRSNVGLQ